MKIGPADVQDSIELERGVTRVLTDEGWEDAFYVDPADDWILLDDGSWSSPDGRTRSWPAFGPEPESLLNE
ncbi:MAG: hypothetical protein FIA92_09910 [Chloroflexi bacterium]|nr:hypothetical protein [Chloroflexota bacterium]